MNEYSRKDPLYWEHWYAEHSTAWNEIRRQRRYEDGYVCFSRGRIMSEIDTNEYATWLKEKRIAKGVSVDWCAKFIGIAENTWAAYERGTIRPCEYNFRRIERLLGAYNG